MRDLLGTEKYIRTGQEMHDHGLYLDLGAHAAQLFLFEPVSVPDTATSSDYANTAKHV